MILKFPPLFILLALLFCSCNLDSNASHKLSSSLSESENASGETAYTYNLNKPEHKWGLPPDLFEVSGNSWIDKNHLLIIEDLRPNLYVIRLEDNNAVVEKTIAFKENSGKKFDVEDVTIANNTAYALWSHGVIYKISNWQNKPQVKDIPTFLGKENNTEGICFDPVTNTLLVACKNNAAIEDEKKSTRAIYQFDLSTEQLKKEPFLLIHRKDFTKAEGEKIDFYPSAIAVHPVTHDVYILSTKENKGMAVYTHDGKFKSFQSIDKKLLPQPEGICFAPDGTLYISTEGKEGELGYIFQFNPAR